MKEEFLTISEFAKRAGVSRPTIYSKLDNELSSFCKVVKGKKVINIAALSLFGVKESVKNFTDNESLSRMVSMLEKELDIKNKQIDTLNHQVEELNDRLKESHILIGRQQELQAIEKKEEAPAETIIIEPTPEPAAPDPEEELSDKEIYKRALEKLPPTPKLFDRVLRPELWQKKQQEAIAQMSEKEREVLFKFGFVGDGR
jgi:AcrR family transcriptional regulator